MALSLLNHLRLTPTSSTYQTWVMVESMGVIGAFVTTEGFGSQPLTSLTHRGADW